MTAPRFFGLLALAAAAAGCYQTVPVTSPAPRPGIEVEARITDTGSAALGQLLGEGVETVRGNYEGTSADTIRLRVLAVTRRNGREDFWQGEPVGLSRADIATLGERKLSRSRTAGAAAIAVLVAALVKLGFDGKTNTTGTRNPPPSTQ